MEKLTGDSSKLSKTKKESVRKGKEARESEDRFRPGSPELSLAIERTLYHHPKTTPGIISMFTGYHKFPPPLPTNEEKKAAQKIVEEMIEEYPRIMKRSPREIVFDDRDDDLRMDNFFRNK